MPEPDAPPADKAKKPPNPHPVRRAAGQTLMVIGAGLLLHSCRPACRPAPGAPPRAAAAAQAGAFAGVVPPLEPGFVVDKAGAFSPAEHAALTNEIAALEAATGGGQMGVAVFTTLSGVPAADAALRIARAWGLGRAGVDDGALLLIATEDREVRLEIGLGWEGAIPDARAGDAIRAITPDLKAGDWGAAALGAVRQVRAAALGEPAPKRPAPEKKGETPIGAWGLFSLLAGFLLWAGTEPDPPPGRSSGPAPRSAGDLPSPPPFRPPPRPSGGFRGGGGGRFGGGGAGGRF
ncbi:MAG: TPM domain-containing protein [Kiritimatiellae bacterium]|nr:TPM domain-containing protein [Kiritimatiellia bacterium]